MKVLVFYGSVRTERQGIKAARFVLGEMKNRGHDVTLIDPKEYDFGFIDKMYHEFPKEEKPAKMKELSDMIRAADGFVIVSGEYNNSIPPALSNLMNHFYKEYFHKPAGLVTYSSGRFSGVRAAVQLRTFLGTLGMIIPPSLIMIPEVSEAFDEEGTPLQEGHEKRFDKFASEFDWYMKVISEGKEKHGKPS